MLKGRLVTIPKRDQWDESQWRVLAVTPGGPFEQLILRLQAEAKPVAVRAAMRRAAVLMGAVTLNIIERYKDYPNTFDMVTLTAAFPGSAEAWHKAHRRHMNKKIGDKRELPSSAYHRRFWTPISDNIEWKKPFIRRELPPGTWRLGGLGQHQRVQKSVDYRLFRILWARHDWQKRLNGYYTHARLMAEPTQPGRKEKGYGYKSDKPIALVKIPGRKGIHIKVPTRELADGRLTFFVPEGCQPIRRADLYAHCDKF